MFFLGLTFGCVLCAAASVFDDLWLKARREALSNRLEKKLAQPSPPDDDLPFLETV